MKINNYVYNLKMMSVFIFEIRGIPIEGWYIDEKGIYLFQQKLKIVVYMNCMVFEVVDSEFDDIVILGSNLKQE